MVIATDFLSEIQRENIIKIFNLLYGSHKDRTILEEVNMEINYPCDEERFRFYIEQYQKYGFLSFNTLEKSTNEHLARSIKMLDEITAEIEKHSAVLESLAILKQSNLDLTAQAMLSVRLAENFGAEYRRSIIVLKSKTPDTLNIDEEPKSDRSVINVYIELENIYNSNDVLINKLFQLDWKERSKLVDKLKKYDCPDIKIEKCLITKRIINNFNIMKVYSDDEK